MRPAVARDDQDESAPAMLEESPESFDPYATLQIHSDAPFDLIVEAYWALCEEQRALAAPGVDMRDLNAAYGQLIELQRVEAPVRSAHSVREQSAPSRAHATAGGSFYARLAVSPHASTRIIEVA